MLKPLIYVAVIMSRLAAGVVSAGENWPEFRGPGQQGWSDSTDLPVTWSESASIRFKTAIPGQGWSSPVVFAGQVWMTTATDDGHSLRAVCVDASDGRITHDIEVFHYADAEPKNDFNSWASPTPAVEKGRAYVSFGNSGNACIDTGAGAIIWKSTELRLNHKEGPGSSPILYRDKFILHCDGMDVQYIVALDKDTGKIAWKTPRSRDFANVRIDMRKAYSTPVVVEVNGRDQLISVGAQRAYGYDPADGKELWNIDLPGFSNIPTPVYSDGVAYLSTGYTNPELWAVRIDGPPPAFLWKAKQGAPLKPSILVVQGCVYMISDHGIVRCLDAATGQTVWQSRLLGECTASPVFAGGLIYFFDEHGRCAVIKPGRALEVVAQNQLDGRILASPAIAGRAVYVRTDSSLYRIEK